MKTGILNYLLIVSIVCIAASCTTPRYAYSPAAQNVPVFIKKGDSKLGAYYSTNSLGGEQPNGSITNNRSRGFDLNGAFAITDHFAVQTNYFYRWEKTTVGADSIILRYKRNLTEVGLGYFLPANNKGNVYFQFFAGIGLGRFSFTDVDKIAVNFHQANVTKIYLQPAVIFGSKSSFTTSLSIRASILSYSKIKTSYNPSQLKTYKLDSLNKGTRIFFEPAVVARYRFKKFPGVSLEVQGGIALPASRQFVNYRFLNFSIGTSVDIGSFFRKEK